MELTTIKNSIHEIRGKRVILDYELAKMYEVETRELPSRILLAESLLKKIDYIKIFQHSQLAKICLNNGYPVLVEKPFTESYIQACELSVVAKNNNKLCMASYQLLYAKKYLVLKDFTKSEADNLEFIRLERLMVSTFFR